MLRRNFFRYTSSKVQTILVEKTAIITQRENNDIDLNSQRIEQTSVCIDLLICKCRITKMHLTFLHLDTQITGWPRKFWTIFQNQKVTLPNSPNFNFPNLTSPSDPTQNHVCTDSFCLSKMRQKQNVLKGHLKIIGRSYYLCANKNHHQVWNVTFAKKNIMTLSFT